MYLNGAYLGATSVARSNTPGGLFSISGNPFYSQGFKGQIYNVKIWNSKLESNEINESMHTYAKGSLTASKTLLAHYDFNEYTEGALVDRSGSNKTLVPSSALTWNTESLKTTGIVETSTAFSSLQNVIKFNRTYLTAAGGWTSPSGVTRYKALVVAGGGGGGGGPHDGYNDHMNGGGGGAGGLKTSQALILTAAAVYPIKVGAGGSGTIQGAAGTNTASAPTKGQSSELGTVITTTGGGAGGYMSATGTVVAATSGGSGGGGGGQANAAYPIAGAAGTSGEGNSGGNGFDWTNTFQGAGGGGGKLRWRG
jgi:hypothetical protein